MNRIIIYVEGTAGIASANSRVDQKWNIETITGSGVFGFDLEKYNGYGFHRIDINPLVTTTAGKFVLRGRSVLEPEYKWVNQTESENEIQFNEEKNSLPINIVKPVTQIQITVSGIPASGLYQITITSGD
ncbi:hypothetical protein [uncultured Gammaproteobacteria bacterium]|nr:hypothetical protein [uncultured Gammaproteobacteria bacterium]